MRKFREKKRQEKAELKAKIMLEGGNMDSLQFNEQSLINQSIGSTDKKANDLGGMF